LLIDETTAGAMAPAIFFIYPNTLLGMVKIHKEVVFLAHVLPMETALTAKRPGASR